MNDPYPRPEGKRQRSLLDRLSALLSPGPDDREQLLTIMREAAHRNLVDGDALSMIEGALKVSDLVARDIMVPRAQMDVIDIAQSPAEFLPFVLQTSHSRFPVIDGNRDHVIGVLLAKDLLKFYAGPADTDLRSMLRPAVFIPESKRLNVLLRDFRANRNHLAIIVDEFGGVSGLITIEDVLEQIVGDIEDEYDFDEDADNIVAMTHRPGRYRIRGLTELDQFNQVFGTHFSRDNIGTVSGLITDHLGRIPRRGEVIELAPIRFEVLRADPRQLHVLQAERLPTPASESAAAPRLTN